MSTEQQYLTQNPAIMIGILGAGAAAVIALAIVLTESPKGVTVGSGPDVEVTDIDEDVPMTDGDVESPDGSAIMADPGAAVLDEPDERLDAVTVGGADGAEGAEDDNSRAAESDLPTGLVDDPDNGMKSGADPDGGAGSFYPTPSGPEGSDADPLTTD